MRVAWVRRVRRRTTGQRAAAGEGEGEGVDEGVDAAGEQGEARRRGAPLAATANSSPVETPSGSPATSCGRVYYLGKVVKDRTVQLARTLRTTPSMVPAMLPAQPLVTCKSWSHEPAAFAHSS